MGWKLAQVVKGISPTGLLATYDAERHPVAARVLRITMERPEHSGRFVHGLRILVVDKAKAREDLSKSNERTEENNSRIRQLEEQLKQLSSYGHETEAVQGL